MAGERPKRTLPFRDKRGRYRRADGSYTTKANAKRAWRMAERRIMVEEISRATGIPEAEIREEIKGVPTTDIIGEYRGRSPMGKTFRTQPTAEGQAILEGFGIIAGLDNVIAKRMDDTSP